MIGRGVKMLLEIDKIVKKFGKFLVLNECSFSVENGEIVGLIGPNGAGKTTLTNVISGFLRCDSGKILYKGAPIQNKPPHRIAHMGLVRIHQIPRFFKWQTVLHNLMTASLAVPRQRKSDGKPNAEEMIEMFNFKDIKNELAVNISGGQQKLLELAMKLMLDPELLVLDEPYHGVHPSMIEDCNKKILKLNKEYGKTFLIISHNLSVISSLCNRVIVLNFGKVIAEGTVGEIRNNEHVREIYLGEG